MLLIPAKIVTGCSKKCRRLQLPPRPFPASRPLVHGVAAVPAQVEARRSPEQNGGRWRRGARRSSAVGGGCGCSLEQRGGRWMRPLARAARRRWVWCSPEQRGAGGSMDGGHRRITAESYLIWGGLSEGDKVTSTVLGPTRDVW